MDTYTKLLNLMCGVDLDEIIDLDSACMSVFKRLTSDPENIKSSLLIKVQAVLDYTYEKINIGDWKEVSLYLRKTMTIGSYLKLLITIKDNMKFTQDNLKEFFQIIDHGLLFGSPLSKEPMLLQKSAAILHKIVETLDIKFVTDCDIKLTQYNYKIHTRFKEIERIRRPSLETFYKDYLKTETPVILTGCIDHWPALTRWKDNNYLLKLAGLRTVPIEVGREYTDHEWTQKLMTLEDFIKNHVIRENLNLGYLAQYQLFEHIPELLKDISKPDYCSFAEDDIEINAWYGPKSTVSPLHQDCKHNLFAQVIGDKSIYLFPPTDTENLYPHREDMLSNTAIVDPRKSNFATYPKYANAKGRHCILKPGELLYIPKDWWHFVEALTISFSVSFWWGKTV